MWYKYGTRKLPRICHFHKKRFAECPKGCGHASIVDDKIYTLLERRRKKSAIRAAAKERVEKRRAKRLLKEKPPRHCIQCGVEMSSKWKPKYCSRACGCEHRKSLRPPPKVRELKVLRCAHCFQALPRVEGKVYLHSAKYCSARCREEKRKQRRKPPLPKKVLDDRECVVCGGVFTPVNRLGKACSAKCKMRVQVKAQMDRHKERQSLRRCFFWPEKRQCLECGKEVTTTFESPDKKYCSKKCSKRRQKRVGTQRRLVRDTAYKVMCRLSSRIRDALRRKGVVKSSTSLKYLGCSTAHLREHLGSRFTGGMSWSNYGVLGWHVDHIIPCAAFDLAREDHQMICFNYRNLRPLWWRDNVDKCDSVDADVIAAADPWVLRESRLAGVPV